MTDILRQIELRIRDRCGAAYLYGSQLTSPSSDRDIDVLLISEPENRTVLLSELVVLQSQFRQVIHAIFVTEAEIDQNRHLQAIVASARPLVL